MIQPIPDLERQDKDELKRRVQEALAGPLGVPKRRIGVHWNSYHMEHPWRRVYAMHVTISRDRDDWEEHARGTLL